jgi:hypothetical protein
LDSGKVRLDAWRHALAPDLDNGREALARARSADDAVRFVQIATVISSALSPSAYREQAELARESLPLVERIDDAEMQGVLCVVVFAALGSTQPRRAADLIRRCVSRVPTELATDTDGMRSARLLSLCVLARAEVHVGESSSAEKALVAARKLVDPTSPPNWQQRLALVESVVAAARGDAAAGLRWARHRVALLRSMGERDVPGRINLIDAELGAGDAASATAAASALLAELAGGRDERSLTYCRLLLGAGHLRLGDPEQARRHLGAGWLNASLFNLEPMFADFVSLLAALERRFEVAARLAGYADARNADRRRERNEADAITRAQELARAALGESTFDDLHAEGLTLSAAEIETLAFGPASAASGSPPRQA